MTDDARVGYLQAVIGAAADRLMACAREAAKEEGYGPAASLRQLLELLGSAPGPTQLDLLAAAVAAQSTADRVRLAAAVAQSECAEATAAALRREVATLRAALAAASPPETTHG